MLVFKQRTSTGGPRHRQPITPPIDQKYGLVMAATSSLPRTRVGALSFKSLKLLARILYENSLNTFSFRGRPPRGTVPLNPRYRLATV